MLASLRRSESSSALRAFLSFSSPLPHRRASSSLGGLLDAPLTAPLTSGLSLASRQLPLLCVDDRGGVSEVSVPVGKLQDEARISMRELLAVEQPLSSSTQPRILPRRHCVAFHLGAARGLLFSNRAYLFTQPRLSSVAPRTSLECRWAVWSPCSSRCVTPTWCGR